MYCLLPALLIAEYHSLKLSSRLWERNSLISSLSSTTAIRALSACSSHSSFTLIIGLKDLFTWEASDKTVFLRTQTNKQTSNLVPHFTVQKTLTTSHLVTSWRLLGIIFARSVLFFVVIMQRTGSVLSVPS